MPFKSLLLSLFRFLKDVIVEDLSSRSKVNPRRIGAIERGEVKEVPAAEMEQLLTAMGCSKAEVVLVTSFLEALDDLDQGPAIDPELAAAHERFIASCSRQLRRRLRHPGAAKPSPYPGPHQVELDRLEARDSWTRLRELKSLKDMLLLVRASGDYQSWAFVELLCDKSVRAASKDPRLALDLATVAVRIAARHLAAAWELWRVRLLGFAVAHLANALRVAGRLDAADRTLATARRLWAAGLDSDQILDPGRLLDLEASLRRDQRRFPEALDLLERAAPLTRRPEHVGLKMASILAVMGAYHRAVEVLTGLGPRVAAHPERRLQSIQRFNLAVALSHVGRFQRASRLLPVLRRLVQDDKIDRIRLRWLEGRIAAGLGRTEEALQALDDARNGFKQHGLGYDVALSLLETAGIRLERGELGEVQRLTAELAPFFEENGVHGEALKALVLFEEAAARQAATAELARLLLAWLFRAQHDQELVFSPPSP